MTVQTYVGKWTTRAQFQRTSGNTYIRSAGELGFSKPGLRSNKVRLHPKKCTPKVATWV